jgi:TonB family protein
MNLRLLLGYLLYLALFATAGASLAQAPSLTPPVNKPPETRPEQTPALDLPRLERSVRPSVIWITVFDRSGKLLRTQTGFFISTDGRLVTTAHAIEGGINAVAKTADGGIHNVSGILATSTALDLAILQADVKGVPFLALNKNVNLPIGTRVGLVGSVLAGNEGSSREVTIAAQQSDRLEIRAAISPSSIGSPVVNADAEVVGIVISAGEKAAVRPSNTLDSLLSQIASKATPRWPKTAETSPSPRPMAKPRLVYAPAPSFPPKASRSGAFGSGRFRLTFDGSGNVRNVEILQSTGNALYDQAATNTLRQWRSAPGHEGVLTVPITFQAR